MYSQGSLRYTLDGSCLKVSFSYCYTINTFSSNINFQVEEIYNFSQDDLLTEDILVLDTNAEVFVWVGQSVDSKEKQNAFEIGQVLGIFTFQLLKLFSLWSI